MPPWAGGAPIPRALFRISALTLLALSAPSGRSCRSAHSCVEDFAGVGPREGRRGVVAGLDAGDICSARSCGVSKAVLEELAARGVNCGLAADAKPFTGSLPCEPNMARTLHSRRYFKPQDHNSREQNRSTVVSRNHSTAHESHHSWVATPHPPALLEAAPYFTGLVESAP
jgi:hypothetical protein